MISSQSTRMVPVASRYTPSQLEKVPARRGRRPEKLLGLGGHELFLYARQCQAPQRDPTVAVMVVVEVASGRRSPHEEAGFAVAEPFAHVGQPERDLPDTVEGALSLRAGARGTRARRWARRSPVRTGARAEQRSASSSNPGQLRRQALRDADPLTEPAPVGRERLAPTRVDEGGGALFVQFDHKVTGAAIAAGEEVSGEAQAREAHHGRAGHTCLCEERIGELPEPLLAAR